MWHLLRVLQSNFGGPVFSGHSHGFRCEIFGLMFPSPSFLWRSCKGTFWNHLFCSWRIARLCLDSSCSSFMARLKCHDFKGASALCPSLPQPRLCSVHIHSVPLAAFKALTSLSINGWLNCLWTLNFLNV